jgi:hypothetical protein
MFKFRIFASLALLCSAQTFASQQQFDPRFLYEGMVYSNLFKSQIMEEDTYADVLIREGLRPQPEPNNGFVVVDLEDLPLDPQRYMPLAQQDGMALLDNIPVARVYTSQDLDDALVAEFRRNKTRAMAKTLLRPGFLMLSQFSVFGLGIWALNTLMPNTMALGIGIAGFVIIEITQRNLDTAINAFWHLKISPLGDPLESLEAKYAAKKRFLSKPLQEKIERVFQDARKDDQTGSKKDFLDRVLKLPVKSKKPIIDKVGLLRLLSGYKDEKGQSIAEPIMLACVNHLARFTERAGPNDIPKWILYLEGPPGVGKTRLIKGLAKLMGLSLVKHNLTNSRLESTPNEPGTLFTGTASAEERNHVAFFDEADRVLNQEGSKQLNLTLPLLEPSNESIFDAYIGQDMDTSHMFTILAGNHNIKDRAQLDRCLVVHVLEVDREEKALGINQSMLPLLTKSEVSEMNLQLANCSPALRQMIDLAIWKDKDGGFRPIQKQLQALINKERLNRLP